MKFLDGIYLKLFYNIIGVDLFGNVYYQEKYGSGKRIVRYKNACEASLVPPVWHAWLHYIRADVPQLKELTGLAWQKSYTPNVTSLNKEWKSSKYDPCVVYYAMEKKL